MIEKEVVVAGASAIGLVVALCQIIKGYIGSKYIPLVSLVLGIGIVALSQKTFSIEIMLTGLTIGLGACGAFAGTKSLIKK